MTKQKKMESQSSVPAHPVSLGDLELEGRPLTTAVGFSVCVRVLRQNWRQGTVACKGRSDVARSNKKPWKQKGTGKARAGSARSPLWRGGGVIFGPQERSRVLTVAKKVKRKVNGDLLRMFIATGNVISVDWVSQENKPSTARAYSMLRNLSLHDKRVIVFVSVDDVMTQASLINLPNVRLMYFDQSNVYDLANSDCWVFFRKDADAFKEMVSKWI